MHIFRRKWLKWFLIAFALAVCVAIVALYAMRSRPVVWRANENEAKSIGGPFRSILNPFRNRDPEYPAEAFLNMLKTNECDEAMVTLPFTEEYRSYICRKEFEHHLFSWRMTDREDTPQGVKMVYWSRRAESDDIESPIFITTQKDGAAWRVTNFGCWY